MDERIQAKLQKAKIDLLRMVGGLDKLKNFHHDMVFSNDHCVIHQFMRSCINREPGSLMWTACYGAFRAISEEDPDFAISHDWLTNYNYDKLKNEIANDMNKFSKESIYSPNIDRRYHFGLNKTGRYHRRKGNR